MRGCVSGGTNILDEETIAARVGLVYRVLLTVPCTFSKGGKLSSTIFLTCAHPPHSSSSIAFTPFSHSNAQSTAACFSALKEGGGTSANLAADEGAPSFVIDTQPTGATVSHITTLPTTAEKEMRNEMEAVEKEKGGERKGGQYISSRWSSAPSGGGGPPTKKRGLIGRKEERRMQVALLSREDEKVETEELYTVTILVPNEAMGLLIGRCKEGGRGGRKGRALTG